jgi:inhibitor of KinA sporulation pathway (predicted exonuclease)
MLVIYDLEMTAWPGSAARGWSGPGEHPEIIQIGAVRLDAALHEIATLDVIVRPRLNPVLSDFIIALTGITQERVGREGVDIEEGLQRLAAFADGARLLLANGYDARTIRINVELAGIEDPLVGRPFASTSRHFRRAAGREEHVVSSTLPEVFGFAQPGRTHDGLADARAVAEALRRTLPPGGVPALIAAIERDT